jgi:hypothetical protein
MSMSVDTLETVRAATGDGYKYGFVTDIEADEAPPGLNEDTVRFISAKKGEPAWLLEWRIKAFRRWETMTAPNWSKLAIAPIDYQGSTYYSAPKQGPKSLDEVDPELLKTYEKLGIPLGERAALAGIAVDAVFDSVSVATTFKDTLADMGIIFCSFGEAVREHPDLIKKYLGSVVPPGDNFFSALNSAVFSDGSFAYIPPGVRCPMELSTYFRINAAKSGQFERTLLIAAPRPSATNTSCTQQSWNSSPWKTPRSNTVRCRTGIPAMPKAAVGSTTLSPSAAPAAVTARKSRGPRWKRVRPSPGNIRVACWKAIIRLANSIQSPSPTIASRPIPEQK